MEKVYRRARDFKESADLARSAANGCMIDATREEFERALEILIQAEPRLLRGVDRMRAANDLPPNERDYYLPYLEGNIELLRIFIRECKTELGR